MEEQQGGKWKKVLPWAIGGVVLLLFLRGRSGGSALSTEKSQRQSVADSLQAQAAADQYAYQKALYDMDLRIKQSQSQQYLDYQGFLHRLATDTRTDADAAFSCPVGKARIDPSTGQPYCRTPAKNSGGSASFSWSNVPQIISGWF
jgi:hypothetical protein